MKIISNRDLIWDTDKYDVILVGTSIYCMLTNGFQSKMKYKYPFIEEINNKTNYGDYRKLGTRVTIKKDDSPIISLMYICGYPNKNKEYLDYNALEACLRTAEAEFRNKKIATTIIGCSLFDGNGKRDKCIDLINKIFKEIYVYDYIQLNRKDEIQLQKDKILSVKHTNYDKFILLKNNEEKILKKLYLK